MVYVLPKTCNKRFSFSVSTNIFTPGLYYKERILEKESLEDQIAMYFSKYCKYWQLMLKIGKIRKLLTNYVMRDNVNCKNTPGK